MTEVTIQSLGRECSKLRNQRAILWRADLADLMKAENIPYLSTYTFKIRSKTSPEPMVVTAYDRPNGAVLVWRVKHQLITTEGMKDRYWNWTAQLPWTGADYYPFARELEEEEA